MDWKRGLSLIAALALMAGGLFLLFYESGGVTITWETATEVNTMGFNVYRSESSVESEFEQVNDELIPAKGDPLTGATYEVKDDQVKPGRLYFYQVEEVEWGGTRNRYPETVQARAGVSRVWLIAEGAVLILLGGGLFYLQLRPGRDANQEQVVENGS